MPHPMARGLKPLDPCTPPEPEKAPETLRKMPRQALFQYAFNPNLPVARNRRRRELGGATTNGAAGAADG